MAASTRRSSLASLAATTTTAATNDGGEALFVEPYEPPDSLWQLIRSTANEKELDLIKRIIGESLVETSLDLHNEVDALLEIWRDYRHETVAGLDQLKEAISRGSVVLPEPPNVRETLKKEINMFIRQMREYFKEEDKFSRQIVANNHNLAVINYVLDSEAGGGGGGAGGGLQGPAGDAGRRSRAPERPQSKLSSRTGSETPLVSGRRSQSRQKLRYRSGSRSSSRHSVSPPPQTRTLATTGRGVADLVEDVEDLFVDEEKLNSFQIDEIVDHLRDLLQKECDTLLKDIDFLYECIDRESEYRARTRSSIREPTLNELKEERRKLENDLLSATGRNQMKIGALPTNLPPSANNRSLHSPVLASRASPPSSATSNASRTSAVSATNILIQTDVQTTASTATTVAKRPVVKSISNGAESVVSKRSNSLAPATEKGGPVQPRQPAAPLSQKGVVVVNSGAIKILSNPQTKPAVVAPVPPSTEQRKLSRNNSVASIASSVESSASSATNSSSKLGSAQKFRQMVLDSRDT